MTGGGDDDDNGLSGDLLASLDGVDCECHNRMVVLVMMMALWLPKMELPLSCCRVAADESEPYSSFSLVFRNTAMRMEKSRAAIVNGVCENIGTS